jgi:hypothetical protein
VAVLQAGARHPECAATADAADALNELAFYGRACQNSRTTQVDPI